ncbi:hypothetical protein JMUB7526_24200 [Staphylococcus aureus]
MEKLNQVMLYVDDVEKAKAFWTETLEFVVVSETPLAEDLSLIHISEPTRHAQISYAVFCLKKLL